MARISVGAAAVSAPVRDAGPDGARSGLPDGVRGRSPTSHQRRGRDHSGRPAQVASRSARVRSAAAGPVDRDHGDQQLAEQRVRDRP